MKRKLIYQELQQAKEKGEKHLAVLIDPDVDKLERLDQIIHHAHENNVSFFFVGGSLIVQDVLEQVILKIKSITTIPIIIFPGSGHQISSKADAFLFLSLISGRNPELLIGNHVVSAPYLRQSGLEILPTGYMLIDGGIRTTAHYISNTQPIPSSKGDVAACTAMAGEMLGLQNIFMDAGSGAKFHVPSEMIQAVRNQVGLPIIVGGGIRTPEAAKTVWEAGADLIVVGNAVENNPTLIEKIMQVSKELSLT